MDEDKDKQFPGYLWRPGSSRQDDPLHLVVAVVITLILVGAIAIAILR